MGGKFELVQLLIEHGADIHDKDVRSPDIALFAYLRGMTSFTLLAINVVRNCQQI